KSARGRKKPERSRAHSSQSTVPPLFVVPALAKTLPPSSPIFHIQPQRGAGESASSKVSAPIVTTRDLLRDAPLLGAAAQLNLGPPLEEYPERIKVNLSHEPGETLLSVNAQAVSSASGISLSRVEAELARLREIPAAAKSYRAQPPATAA